MRRVISIIVLAFIGFLGAGCDNSEVEREEGQTPYVDEPVNELDDPQYLDWLPEDE